MSLKLYMDHHVARAITVGLRLRQIDVLTAYDDAAHKLPDSLLLDRATILGRVLFSQDSDLLVEAVQRQRAGIHFGGVIFARQADVSIGQCIDDLEIIVTTGTVDDVEDAIIYLPL